MQSVRLTRIPRIALPILLIVASVAVLSIVLIMGWLFFYASDLPDIQAMSSFAPEAPTTIPDAYIFCEKIRVVAVPTTQMRDLRNALLASEGDVDQRNVMSQLYHDFFDEREDRKRYGSYSLQVSRQLFCDDHRKMQRGAISELRTSVQLERHFTANQLLDIYLNRAYFGPGIYGIENAAEYYLSKPAAQLSVPEAALLVGLLRSPRRFSPKTNPDRALARRNEVIDAMAQRASITSEQAEQAKGMPLGTVVEDSAKPRP